jgi:hypothetical protein
MQIFSPRPQHILALFLSCIPIILNAENLDSDLLGDNARWSVDASARLNRNTDTQHNAFTYVLGLDVHKVFSHKNKDIGTLMFQPYLVSLNNASSVPFFFDDGDDTQLTWRITNFNFTALAQGRLNIKLGHFEIPYGLEYQEDTNGTLRQFTFGDRGIKADWGMSVNGILPYLEYEIALTRGSGNELTSSHNPHIFSGRIGSPSQKNITAGFSWFYGDVLTGSGTTEHKKLGVDASYFYYQWQFMFESSIGQKAGNDTQNSFAEIAWIGAKEQFKSYMQLGYQNIKQMNKKDSASYWVVGMQWQNAYGFDISAQFKHKLNAAPTLNIEPDLSIQMRYRL